MGTEIKIEAGRMQSYSEDGVKNTKNSQEISKQRRLSRKCICGCNAPMLYAKRECNIPYSNPKSNFKAILKAFFKENQPPPLNTGNHDIDIYDLFHIIQGVKNHYGRLSWRKVSKGLGELKSTSEFRRPLRYYYKSYLQGFEKWLLEKGPVSIGCIDTQIVIIILKEFLPNFLLKKQESDTTANASPQQAENQNGEILELMDQMISDIEGGKIICKKRKLSEENPPSSVEKLGVPPIFVISSSKKTEKNEKILESKQEILLETIPEKTIEVKKEPKPEIRKTAIKEPKSGIKKEKEPKSGIKIEKQPKKVSIEPENKKVIKLDFPNAMTEEFRNKDPSTMNYRTDFRKGYLPIDMQEEHEILEKLHLEKESKTHFIRKKQSAINIKRSCGVTYVNPTESKQKGVRHEFSPLPPLAFQVGTVDRIIPEGERVEYFNLADNIIKDIFEVGKILRITIQENISEEDMKNYLLGLKPDGDEIYVENIKEL